MYLEHWGLKEPPFSITPDPRFVFLSERHRDALAHLLFGVGQGGGGGFVQLTGEVGTGKTTLCRLLLEQLPENTRVALVLNPRLTAIELLETLCEELHLDIGRTHGSTKALVDTLNTYLLDAYAKGLHVVLIIDEAQNLSVDALEQVRLLTNLETDTQKLLQIILLGQPELREILARSDMRQLAQRITARYHLMPLDANETGAYLRHRFRVAGGLHSPFSASAVQRVHKHSGGVPRLINVIAERALLGGYAHDATKIEASDIDRAAREALAPARRETPAWKWAIAAGAVLASILAWMWWPRATPSSTMPAQPSVAQAATRSSVAALKPVKPVKPVIPFVAAAALPARLEGVDASGLPAWSALLHEWKSGADPSVASTCPPAIEAGLYCLRARNGTLDKVFAQGRPVLLHLRAKDGASTWALLLGADAVRARVQIDTQTFDVDRLALVRAWNGESIALWRGPDALTESLTPDGRGPAVDWVHAHLDPAYTGPAVLDSAMRSAVREFQASRGLTSDGVIGPATLMALAARDAGPRLRTQLD
ncbi:ATPase AAA [Lysobacter helvus]|uniref:ATPase AAA n=2 Tax=Lysobacteraceae TaxID=32033 RepID=A0ABN6FP79_9GAMM|nr:MULTISPECIES: ExeA family protein [Lysobacter]BCT91385.1 ATPase AAA [Lysobacter caseinilyticus]BCT94538.1 ATPase AAA [Lysobacter helvus]